MIIADMQTENFSIPLKTPFQTAARTAERIEGIRVTVITDTGERGYGEAPSTAVVTGDTTGSVRCAVEDWIRPALLGMEIEEMDAVQQKLHACILNNTGAKAAVDMALYDLYARRFGAPLCEILGGTRRELETDLTISVNSVDEMVKDSLAAVGRGFRILKIKVGREGMRDVSRVDAIRQAVGPGVVLRVDANQGWTPKQAVRIIRAMEDRGLAIDLVEQPVSAADPDGMKLVTRSVSTPVLADESVFSPRDAMRVIQEHLADLINIKLMKTGGIYRALQICSIAEIYGMECMMGCMLESRLSVSAAAHLAAAKRIITRVDLDGPSLCREDPYEGGPVFEQNKIRMAGEPGTGVRPVLYP